MCFKNPIMPVGPTGNTCAGSNPVVRTRNYIRFFLPAWFDENQWRWLAFTGRSVACMSGLRSRRAAAAAAPVTTTAQLLRPVTTTLVRDWFFGSGWNSLGCFWGSSYSCLLSLFEAMVQSRVQRFEPKVPLLFIMLLYCLQVYGFKGRLTFYFPSWWSCSG